MRNRPVAWLTSTVLLLTAVAGGVLAALKHEPGFYRRGAVEPGDARQKNSEEFLKQAFKLINRISAGRGQWSFTFTEEQINSFFEEDFTRWPDADALARVGIRSPRVHFDNDTMRVAFRYGTGVWSTVLTYEVKIWLAPTEINTLCVEILQRKAGGVPIAAQSMLNDFKELARNKSIDVTWFRHEGNPVAVIRFPNNHARPNAQLLRFEVADGHLIVEGQSVESAAP